MSAQWLSEDDRFAVWTPLGRGLVYAWDADPDDTQWLTFINSTGEPFWWRNKMVRREASVTNAYPQVTGFMGVNIETKKHIERYKATGALPRDFDPARPLTWP